MDRGAIEPWTADPCAAAHVQSWSGGVRIVERVRATLGRRRVLAERKRSAATAFRLAQPYMLPGPYWISDSGKVGHLTESWWPDHFPLAKRHPPDPSTASEYVRRFLKGAHAATTLPTLLVHKERGRRLPDEGWRGVLAFRSTKGSTVAFCRDGKNVMRVYAGGKVPELERTLRPLMEEHLGAKTTHYLEDGVLIESLRHGTPFASLSRRRQADVFKELLRRYTTLVEATKDLKPTTAPHELPDDWKPDRALTAWRLPVGSAFPRPQPEKDAICLRIPSHGDLHVWNLFVGASGGIELIDFEHCDFLPFYYDALQLALDIPATGRHSLIGHLLAGTFDTEVGRLWEAAGRQYSTDELWRALRHSVEIYAVIWGRPQALDWSALELPSARRP